MWLTLDLSNIFLANSSQRSFSSKVSALLNCWINSSVTSSGFLMNIKFTHHYTVLSTPSPPSWEFNYKECVGMLSDICGYKTKKSKIHNITQVCNEKADGTTVNIQHRHLTGTGVLRRLTDLKHTLTHTNRDRHNSRWLLRSVSIQQKRKCEEHAQAGWYNQATCHLLSSTILKYAKRHSYKFPVHMQSGRVVKMLHMGTKSNIKNHTKWVNQTISLSSNT